MNRHRAESYGNIQISVQDAINKFELTHSGSGALQFPFPFSHAHTFLFLIFVFSIERILWFSLLLYTEFAHINTRVAQMSGCCVDFEDICT